MMIYKKYSFSLIFFLAGTWGTLAQTLKEDVILLRNGGVLRGIILDSTQISTLSIKCYDHNVYVINRDDVKGLQKDTIDLAALTTESDALSKKGTPAHWYFKKKIKYNGSLSYGINYDGNISTINFLGINFSALYNLSPWVAIGIQAGHLAIFNETRSLLLPSSLVLGYRSYNNSLDKNDIGNRFEGRRSVPVCLSYEQLLNYSKISSTLHLSLGYDFNISPPINKLVEINNPAISQYSYYKTDFTWKDGIVINPEIRFSIPMNSKFLLMPSIGYFRNIISFSMDEESYSSNPWYTSGVEKTEIDGKVAYKFLYLKLSVGF